MTAKVGITGHTPDVVVGSDPPPARADKLARWQQGLEKAIASGAPPERIAALQAEVDKASGLSGMTKEQRIAHLRAQLAQLEG